MKKILVALLAIVPLMLLNSCAAPFVMLGLWSTSPNSEMKEIYREIPEATWAEPSVSESTLTLNLVNITDEGENVVYVGEANGIVVYFPEAGDADHLVWKTSMGRIEKGGEKNVYNFFIDKPNLEIEITATDTTTGRTAYLICRSDYIPMPIAYLQAGDNGSMSTTVFKQQKMLWLDLPSVSTPILCDCKSFRITRIAKNGTREELENRSNGFSEQVKSLVAKASAGDIYVFDQIKVSCPGYTAPKLIKSIVYTLE